MSYMASRKTKLLNQNFLEPSGNQSLLSDNRQSTNVQLSLRQCMSESPLASTQKSLQAFILSSPVNQKTILPVQMYGESRLGNGGTNSNVAINQPVVQAVWHFVEETGRERHYNLKDNKDGSFTHTKSKVTYRNTGKKTKNGEVLLTPVNSIAPTMSGTIPTGSTNHDPKNILFRIADGGKLVYLPNNSINRINNVGKFLEMDPKNFPTFKNGGKRSQSSKIMDPVTLTRYHYDGKKFYQWNKNLLSGKGNLVSGIPQIGQSKSDQDLLAEKLKNGELVDRRREDRSSEDLSPFDVGPYKSNVSMEKESNPKLSRSFPKLSGTQAWTSDAQETNRDHIPSGESLNQRGGSGAYDRGFTIAIPNYLMHQPFSPTFGTDNSIKNGLNDEQPDGKTKKRVIFDSENPSTAFYKDSSYMLNQTFDQDYSSNHKFLNLSKPKNRARQLGAYRHIFRRNARLNKLKGKQFGINPFDPAMDYVVNARVHKRKKKKMTKREGTFRYFHVKNKNQGELIAKMFSDNLLKKRLAKQL